MPVLAGALAAQAPAGGHWAFVPPVRPAVPAVADASWPRDDLDRFVLARLEREGLTPAPEADRPTLLRRASFALTGLPPRLDEILAFVRDPRPDAFERVVDRLLASPHYGERMAQRWLDLARYADSNGYHADGHRDMWKWRDWVIDAFNRNLPFDRFTLEQLAGDLLPDCSTETLIATGFNRNAMTNVEGGADPAEYAVRYVVDRVNTTATVWLGLTMKCAECHDHKYDPLTQRDFYRFFAFFNNVPEQGLDGYYRNPAPALPVPDAAQAQALQALVRQEAALQRELEALAPVLDRAQRQWEPTLGAGPPLPDRELVGHWTLDGDVQGVVADRARPAHDGRITGAGASFVPGKVDQGMRLDGSTVSVDCGRTIAFAARDAFSIAAWTRPGIGGAIAARLQDSAGGRGFELVFLHGRVWLCLAHKQPADMLKVVTRRRWAPDVWHHVAAAYDGSGKAAGVRLWVDGERQEVTVEADALAGSIVCDEALRLGRRELELPFQGVLDDVRVYRRVLDDGEVEALALAPVRAAAAIAEAERTPTQADEVRVCFRQRVAKESQRLFAEMERLQTQQQELLATVPTTMVMLELPKARPAHVRLRGDYRRLGEAVEPGVPAALPPLPDDAPRNRLGLARWLVDPRHPLTARVTANRLWEWMLGQGLVRTGDDLGTRGTPPTHPELLDWLACELVESGWDVKRFVKRIVSSATFLQASAVPVAARERDPDNRLYGRMGRPRLDAEAIRDNALALAGLLDLRLGGPSVRPHQPAGVWEEIAFGGGYSSLTYEPSRGSDQYRRGIYVYWKRSSPYASFALFDAPTREVCTVTRAATNTPLQALALLNDPVLVECARGLAARILTESGASDSDDDRLGWALRLAWARPPHPADVAALRALLDAERRRFALDPAGAQALLAVGDWPAPTSLAPVELAAWAQVASAILNASETITRG